MLEVENLSKTYYSGFWNNLKIDAVKNISFKVNEGEIFGLIGGSGCGKTTASRMIAGFLKPSSGRILFENQNVVSLKRKEWFSLRKKMQMVFQNPHMTFNPRFTIYQCCAEPIRVFHLAENKEEEYERVCEMLDHIGVPRDQMKKYPHEISGGQAQRISIARALAVNPKLLICDEPTSMLDVSVQAQILSLLKNVQKSQNLGMIFISHDLDVIRAVCHRVAVMKNGQIIEEGSVEEIFSSPQDVYTKELISASI